MLNFYTVLLQIHSGNCLQKIDVLDLSSIKLLQNEQGCNFFASQCSFQLVCLCGLRPLWFKADVTVWRALRIKRRRRYSFGSNSINLNDNGEHLNRTRLPENPVLAIQTHFLLIIKTTTTK